MSRSRILLAIFLVALPLSFCRAAEPSLADLLKVHTTEAQGYQIFLDEKKSAELELQPKPAFSWTNVVREQKQLGHLFVWTHAGRPEAIGTMFSARLGDPKLRMLVHEFHTLSTGKLLPLTPENSRYQWKPEQGIDLAVCEGAPAVAENAAQRLSQMRSLARTFAAQSKNGEDKPWELRLLTTPLYQYKPASPDVLEGALFAMVSSAGTDPEVLLLLEARRGAGAKSWTWHSAAARFSDKDLTIKREGKMVWSSLEDDSHKVAISDSYRLMQTKDKRYMCYVARLIEELPEGKP